MIIQIDEKTRIKGTAKCWELQRLRNYKGDKKWEPYKWFVSFRSALEEAVHSEIRLHPANTLSEAIDAVAVLIQKYERLIPSEYRLVHDDGCHTKTESGVQ